MPKTTPLESHMPNLPPLIQTNASIQIMDIRPVLRLLTAVHPDPNLPAFRVPVRVGQALSVHALPA